MEQFSTEQNQLKYSREGKDLIDEWADTDQIVLIIACNSAIQRYVRRYSSNADKARNPADIAKIKDYTNRLVKQVRQDLKIYALILQLKFAVNEIVIDFQNLESLCKKINEWALKIRE